jgi:hypothetical protein
MGGILAEPLNARNRAPRRGDIGKKGKSDLLGEDATRTRARRHRSADLSADTRRHRSMLALQSARRA